MVDPSRAVVRRAALAEVDTGKALSHAPEVLAILVPPPRARFSLRLDASLLPDSGQVAGFALETAINRRTISVQRTAMRLGPDEWLLCGPENEAGQIAGDVEAALAGQHFALVDVGHRYFALAVSGAQTAHVLNAGCPLDLSAAAFPTGTATRTLLGKCEVILARIDEAPTFEIECGRSFAVYVHDFLLESARELRAGT